LCCRDAFQYRPERAIIKPEIAAFGCMARLKKNNSDLHDLLVDYYVVGMTFMSLAGKHCCSDGYIGKRLQKAEGIIEGMLMALDIRLEMDIVVNNSN
ncbi:antiterminator Q family protein, partial [Escherichia coli]|nr:antiterminator Q family protein [Escherichia coli]